MLPAVWEHYPDDFLEYTRVSSADAESYRGMIRAIDRGEDHAGCTVRFAYNGGYIWEKINVTAVRDSEGKVVRGQGYSVNITGRKTAEERIRRERLRLKTMENGVFESFSYNITKASDPEIRTSDRGMTEGIVNEQMLKEAFELCPPLKSASTAVRDILLMAAARIPDAADRKIFITT